MHFNFDQKPAYNTELGAMYCGDSLELLAKIPDNSVNLVMTSPPFALLRKKEYGNEDQHEYVEWLAKFALLVLQKLKPDGSFVLDLGGAYQKGIPARSLYNFRVLLKFCDEIGFYLAEDFYLNLCCIDPQYFKIHDHIQNFKRHPFGWRFFILQLINMDYSKCC